MAVSDFDDRAFLASLARAAARIETRTEANIETLGELMLRTAQEHTPVQTGRLRRGWKLNKNHEAAGVEITLSNDTPYAIPQEFGWSDHPTPHPMIRPARARAKAAAPLVLRRV